MENVKKMDDLEDLEPSSLSELNPDPSSSSSTDTSSSSTDTSSSSTDTSSSSKTVSLTDTSSASSKDESILLDQSDEKEASEAEAKASEKEATSEAKEPLDENPNESMDLDKLNTFYYLKQKYEQDKKERCNKFALGKEELSWKMKRAYFASKKPKCVNCKRKVGSEFSIKHSDGFRNFLGKCGDLVNPCEFHIEFKVPNVVRIDKELHNAHKKLNELHESVILTKNKVIFGMLDPAGAVSQFDDLNLQIGLSTIELEKYSRKLLQVTNNTEKKEELSNKIVEFNENVAELNILMQKCLEDDEPIKKVVDYLVETIDPSAKHVSQMKYATREIEKVLDTLGREKEYIYHTFDYKTSDLELPTLMEVVKFELGDNNFPPELIVPEEKAKEKEAKTEKIKSRKTRKIRRLTENPNKPANKTVRNLDDEMDLNYVMNNLLQTLIMEGRLEVTPREIFTEIETEYGVTDVKSKYGKIIKEYFGKYIPIWMSVYEDIMDVVYNIAVDKEMDTVSYNIIAEKLSTKNSEVDFSVFKKVIKEIIRRYVTKLDASSEDEDVPRPDWPKSP
jgi:hypothetical protein